MIRKTRFVSHVTLLYEISCMVYSRPSISGEGKVGDLFRRRAALPLASRTDNLWARCLMASLSSCPVCLAKADPIFLTCRADCSCQPPSVSTGIGMNTIPAPLHGSPCLVIFSLYRWVRAWPGVVAALLTRATCRGLTTVISRAVSLPPVQLGMRTSAGLAFEPGMRALSSLVGPRMADAA